MGGCFSGLSVFAKELNDSAKEEVTPLKSPVTPQKKQVHAPETLPERECGSCGKTTQEYSRGAKGELLCRACLRSEDEGMLDEEWNISPEERGCLDSVAGVLDAVSWKYWKPGEQPAKLLDWLYLGDLVEAMDFEMLKPKGITAVCNLIGWWELTARLPEVEDISALYAEQGMEFLQADSEDRLFFDMIETCWPQVEAFLETCRAQGRSVLVNCKAGHNRSACMVVCWLVVREKMTLLSALELVQLKRGTILSNHGFRLQLVRLALQLERVKNGAKVEEPTEFQRQASWERQLSGDFGKSYDLLERQISGEDSTEYDECQLTQEGIGA